MLEEPHYNHKVDNWAVGTRVNDNAYQQARVRSHVLCLGVLLFEMLTGESPFYGTHEEIEEDILAVNYKIPSVVSEGARDLIKRLLKRGILRWIS